jgi:hypothetical protein
VLRQALRIEEIVRKKIKALSAADSKAIEEMFSPAIPAVDYEREAVRKAFPRFQVRKNYNPNGSTYRAFDGKSIKSKPISAWKASRKKAIREVYSKLPQPTELPEDFGVLKAVKSSVLEGFGPITPQDMLGISAETLPQPTAAPDSGGELSGAELIQAERLRQVSVEGWTPEHDDGHTNRELSLAAREYIRLSAHISEGRSTISTPVSWPWDYSWWKPSPDPIRSLVKAGALIAAEIDRLQRVARGVK